MSRIHLTLAACAFAVLCACSGPASQDANAHGLDLNGMDLNVHPGDDFFGFVNGNWVKTTEIPNDRPSWGNFQILADLANRRLGDLITGLDATKPQAGSESAKIADYYASYVDTSGIDAKGLAPIKPELDAIAQIGDKTALAQALGASLRTDVDALNNTNFHTPNLFGLWVAPSFDDPTKNQAYLMQGGLGLPDRDYYLKTDATMVATQAQYRQHIATIFKLANLDNADARAQAVYDLEKKIAQVHVSRADSEDVHKADNIWAASAFAAKAAGLDWSTFFKAAKLDGQQSFDVWQPGAVTGIAALVASQPLEVWKDWLTFHKLDGVSDVLPQGFRDENFAFYGKTLNGTPQQRPRDKLAVAATSADLGDAVGKLYVQKYFPPEAKAKAQAMVANIVAAFDKRIDRLEWMSPQTKAKAKEKLKTLYIGVGYPDKWQDYSGLQIKRGDALGNSERASLYRYQLDLAELAGPVDHTRWRMTPQTVNAVNLPLQNALNFPAAILNPPFYDKDADAVLNYGGIGSTIGHEISHSFDDQGSQFDAYGRLTNWWTPQDFAHFRAAADRLAAEFDAYQPLPDLHVNGKQTLSENIADVAGVSAAYDGYRASLGGKAAGAAQGYGGDQRFFIRFGQVWRGKYREAALRRQLLTDGHAPAMYRADTVRNLDAWYDAFQVKPGDKLYLAPKDRVRIW